MHVIKKSRFVEAAKKHPNQRKALLDLFQELKSSNFDSPNAMRAVFQSLDNVKYREGWWTIDVGGNELRVIAYINFETMKFYVKHIVTHAEYDKILDGLGRG